MRTTTAAASAVTSTPPLLPQPDLSGKNQHKRKEELRGKVENSAEESSVLRHSNQEQVSAASMFPINAADMLVAYSSTVGLNINACSSISGNGKSTKAHDLERGVIETSYNASTAASVSLILQATGFGQQLSNLSESTRRLWNDLEDFIERGLQGVMAAQRGDPGAPSEEIVAELQLQTARTLRQVCYIHGGVFPLSSIKNVNIFTLEILDFRTLPVWSSLFQIHVLVARLTNYIHLFYMSLF